MPSRKKPDWEVRIYGDQSQEIDIDLMAQIVVMLGRELMSATNDPNEQEGTSTAEGGNRE